MRPSITTITILWSLALFLFLGMVHAAAIPPTQNSVDHPSTPATPASRNTSLQKSKGVKAQGQNDPSKASSMDPKIAGSKGPSHDSTPSLPATTAGSGTRSAGDGEKVTAASADKGASSSPERLYSPNAAPASFQNAWWMAGTGIFLSLTPLLS
ncbi:hypothetical protein BJ684DRAFT_20397 [Piptocephalis cylindrospora]|uniref:Uncharacterized protein n=1 Tax=Piptocephalis cylindrospora TaxID=1907219 RepID=A0A4P9Y395_9FUNG|nr:hypothetical protein BJ684DRAFT_20397 [Piptocephalis cylindrospora]|eukprot:RKP13092.1 hypothetical protein BJ684DRAFT_20397 [Piptocephalis cylindrospora]